MKTKRLGRSEQPVSVIGQGTWQLPTRGRAGGYALKALKLGIELGLTHVDTAESYGGGAAEELVGDLIRGRRAAVFVASKVLPSNASYNGTRAACERSLRRLRTDYIDLYMIHWPGRHPIEETMGAMERLVEEGKVRYIGVSNFDVGELSVAQRALTSHRLVANQVLYHLGDRGIENRVLPYCEREAITVVAYSPFGSGRLAACRRAGNRALAAVGARHGKTTHQVALAFLTRHPRVVVIPKAAAPRHVRENASALDVSLEPDDLATIDRAFPVPPPDAPLGMI